MPALCVVILLMLRLEGLGTHMFRRPTEAGMTGGKASRYNSSRSGIRIAYFWLTRKEPMGIRDKPMMF